MIRQAKQIDIPQLIKLAKEFAGSTAFVGNLDEQLFIRNWQNFITNCGVIFILDDFDGMLGAIKYPDINTGKMTAAECFWFVTANKRGNGLELLAAFEEWAKSNGCEKVIMVHLMDSMPEKLATVYKRMGYKAMEIHYAKEL